jgi:bacteriocin biosynthesis cyclodehydratase domain-containing protein
MTKPIILFTEGAFGRAVADLVGRRIPVAAVRRLTDAAADFDAAVRGAGFVGVATWRLYDREHDALDRVCRRAGVRWSSTHLMEDALFIGPLVEPARPPCWRCFRARQLAHRVAPEREVTLLDAYARDRDLGPAGFVRPMAWIAAAGLVRHAHASGDAAGDVVRLDVCSGALLDSRVVGIHACPRCRPRTGAAGDRFVDQLVPRVEEILQ